MIVRFFYILLFTFLIFFTGCNDDNPEPNDEENKDEEPYFGDGPTHFEIRDEGGYYRLYRNDEVFYIKGAAYNDFVDQVDNFGGNAIRTYSVNNTDATTALLEEALNNDISVMLGIWVGRPKDGFDYSDETAVKNQFDNIKKWVNQFKDHPAVMMWSLGNEFSSSDPVMWQHINEIGEMINEIDPYHPVTTVLAGTNQNIIKVIKDYCPSFDLLGINSYEGAVSLAQNKLNEIGWAKPYMICEFGHRGTWDSQVDFTSWGETAGNGLIELTSTQKADKYETIFLEHIMAHYNKSVTCLGSFAFLWGYQTRGHVITWYPMFNRFGKAMETAHAMRYCWTSYRSENHPPRIEKNTDIIINNKNVYENVVVDANSINSANIIASDPDGDPLTFEWVITMEGISFSRNDETFEGSLPQAKGVTIEFDNETATFQVANAGFYRLNCFVFDDNDNVAHASFPFKVEAGETNHTPQNVSLTYDIEMGFQNNSNLPQFLNMETLSKYFYASDPYGIDNADIIDFGFYRSGASSGLCITSSSNSDAAQFIYKGENGFENWDVRNDTRFVLADKEQLGIEQFSNLINDELIYELFRSEFPSTTIKNISINDVILIKTVNNYYGALLVKTWEDSSDGKIVFDLLSPE